MTTAYLTHPRYHAHTLAGHIEQAGRLKATEQLFAETDITARLLCLEPPYASEEQLLRVHTRDYLRALEWTARQRNPVMLGSDTYALPESYEIARLSAGAHLRAVEAVLSGEADNALVAARPPGHHALPDAAMGFCLLANISLAARHALDHYDAVQRVMIVDYDVHHGNGTQAIFYDDPAVFYLSTHQSPFYPGTGMVHETGRGAGQGTTLNVPLPAGHGDETFARIYEQIIWPVARRFGPDLILVSAGFDTHWADLLGQMRLTLPGYAHLSRELIRMAQELCGGRIVFVLEGGYNLDAVSHGLLNIAHALLGEETVSDPLGPPPEVKSGRRPPAVEPLLERVRAIHALD